MTSAAMSHNDTATVTVDIGHRIAAVDPTLATIVGSHVSDDTTTEVL